MPRKAANEAAWAETAKAFPPLLIDPGEEAEPADAPLDEPDQPMPRGRITGLNRIPADWGELPASAPLKSEVQWVRSNRLLVVTELPSGASRVSLGKAKERAPSRSTLDLLEMAITNRAKFLELSFRVMGGGDDDDTECVRRERTSLAEMEALLGQMNEQMDEELLANIPAGIQERTQSCLDDCCGQFGVDLSGEARKHFEAKIADLVNRCVETIGREGTKR